MPSLRQLLARHSSLLILDASSTQIEASLWRGAAATAASSTEYFEGDASTGLSQVVAGVLARERIRIHDLDAIAFCEGPGSILGIRLSAASLRVWRAVRPSLAIYGFYSLPLLAVAHPKLTVVADARRDTWHSVRAGAPHTLLRLSSAELAGENMDSVDAGGLATPASFRRWSALPAGKELQSLPYSASALIAAALDEPFFRGTRDPDAFVAEAPSYATWSPRIHQSPTAE